MELLVARRLPNDIREKDKASLPEQNGHENHKKWNSETYQAIQEVSEALEEIGSCGELRDFVLGGGGMTRLKAYRIAYRKFVGHRVSRSEARKSYNRSEMNGKEACRDIEWLMRRR